MQVATPFLPMGSTYALRGELWGRMAVPLSPMGLPFHAVHTEDAPGEVSNGTWTILDLITARLEICLPGRAWNAKVALKCLVTFGAANAATLFVRHRQIEHATLGVYAI